MFKDGSKVLGGELTLDTDVKSLKLETQQSGVNINVANFTGTTITGETSNARAKCVATQAATSTTQPTLMFHYLSNDDFSDGETIIVEGTSILATTVSAGGASGITDSTANGSVVSIDSGVFFVGGFFVFNTANTIVFETYSGLPSGRIGLAISESTLTSDDDSTLLDPASGSYNYAAPGAARYNIELTLTKKEVTATDPVQQLADENFIQLLRVQDGIKQEEVKYPMYGELDKTLARRTHDESGDYTVTPFNLDLKAHRGISGTTANAGANGTAIFGNNTLFETELTVGDFIYLGSNTTTSHVTAIANNTRLSVQTSLAASLEGNKIFNESEISAGLDAGKAYVKGYEFESIATKYTDVDKGRDVETASGYSISTELGNYVIINNANGTFDVGAHQVTQLHSVPVASINLTSATTVAHTQIGTARIRSIDWEDKTGNATANATNHSNYRAYLWDVDTSNNITGTVGGAQANTRRIQLDTASTSFVNDAYTGASITVSTTSGIDVTNDVRIVDDYVANSTIHYVVANSVLTQESLANTTYEIDFKVKDAESMVVSTLATPSTIEAEADISDSGKYNDNPTGNTLLRATHLNTLVYPLPQTPIKDTRPAGANTISYVFKRVHKDVPLTPTGLVSITAGSSFRFMPGGGELSVSNARENFIVVVKNSNTAGGTSSAQTFVNAVASGSSLPNAGGAIAMNLANGQFLDLGATDNAGNKIRPVIISGDRTTANIHCNTSGQTGETPAPTVDIIYTLESSAIAKEPGPRLKAIVAGNGTHVTSYSDTPTNTLPQTDVAVGQIYFDTPNIEMGQRDSIPISDCFNLTKVVDSGKSFVEVSNTMMLASANDITHMYSFDTGQSDNFYDHGSIKLKPGYSGPRGKIMVVVDYFGWDGLKGYHTVDSYNDITGNYDFKSATEYKKFSYADIPEFTSPTTGETVQLRDSIDLRPRRKNEINDMIANTAAIESAYVPDADGSITADFRYYLSRIDKLTLTKDRKFKVLRGESGLNPLPPPDDEDSMTLYVLNVPAYTFALADITTRYIDNKRFTMRDIGKLEKRIERLEYYTSLTILEKETAARDFSTGTSRDSLFNPRGAAFKSGMLVDSFSGHSVGDVMNDDYKISIEYKTKEARPSFYYDNYRFNFNSAYSNNVTKTGDLITLPYDLSNFIQQPFASSTTSINPFNIVNFVGCVKTLPVSDTWFTQNKRPDVTTNLEGQSDNWTLSPQSGKKGFGTQYDDWTTNWTGEQITDVPQISVDARGQTTSQRRSAKEMGDSKSRKGISANTPPESILKSVGSKFIDQTVVPYMRGQTLQFMAEGLKPLSNVYVYFGETDVSENVRPASRVLLIAVNSTFQTGETIKDSANNRATILMATNTIANNATVYLSNVTGSLTATDGAPMDVPAGQRVTEHGDALHVFAVQNTCAGVTSGATGNVSTIAKYSQGISNGIMQTDDAGRIAGEIYIDDSTHRTGDRLLRITDSALDNVSATTTVSECIFPAKGILQTREQLLISTRETINRRELPNDDAIVTDTTSRTTGKTNWINPLCQTFHVDPNVFPKGLFLKNISLYFSAKDNFIPITMQIRPIINGFPSASKILPFSECVRSPDTINVNAAANTLDANTATLFSFDSPVYLTPDEYGIVLLTNSTEYNIHTAEEGATSAGSTAKISKPAFIGSFLKPQNAGIWEPQADQYITFTAQRCDFTVGVGGNTNFAKFGEHANSASGNTSNVCVDKFKITSSTIDFSDTNIQWKYASSNSTYVLNDTQDATAGYTVISPDQNYDLIDQKIMVAAANGSFRLRAEMTSANSHVSPVIHLDRVNLTVVENLVDNAGLSNNDISITQMGSGYSNVVPQAYTAPITGGGSVNLATTNVHAEVTMNVVSAAGTLSSANSGTHSAYAFVPGEAVMATTSFDDLLGSANGQSGIYGVVSSVTFLDGDPTKNVNSVTVKTNANNSTTARGGGAGGFVNGCTIWASANAQSQDYGAFTGVTASDTKMVVHKANGYISNVIVHSSGSGYVTNPTITLSTIVVGPNNPTGAVDATAIVSGEEKADGGPIGAKYISRRVTLKDGFDASDIKVIINAYKPIGTEIHVYYKVKNSDDPDDFDKKSYTLMNQETSAGTRSKGKDDHQEFIFKTADESIAYISNKVRFETFKVFAIKIALLASTTHDMPRIRDMRAIALD
ncbi:MAG: hypothetical protein CL489_05205 [Acidobacteria bacterium]|nr:hypothetical protein [Acidobacteriota bacterium]